MKFEIKNRFTGAVQVTAEIKCSDDAGYSVKLGLAVKWAVKAGANLAGANLTDANLTDANLTDANLTDANLTGAYITGAYLAGANLVGANITGAYLAGANLAHANLAGAKGISPERVTPLLMLLDQPGKIRAYKLVDKDLRSPIHSTKITYAIGKSITITDADTNPREQCAAGVNVATLDWCLKNWQSGHRVLIVEFEAADIACIPTATDGKFRLHRCAVVAEKHLDLEALGLVQPKAGAEAA